MIVGGFKLKSLKAFCGKDWKIKLPHKWLFWGDGVIDATGQDSCRYIG